MHIDSLSGSPRTPVTTASRHPVLTPQYFGYQQPGYGMPVSNLQRMYAEAQAPRPQAANGPAPQAHQDAQSQAAQAPFQQGNQVTRYPDARQKKLAIRPFDGKELYVGLGSGFLEWGHRFERQVALTQLACGFTWPEDVKVDLLGHYLARTAEKYYNKQVETWWGQWPEHYMYQVAVSEACGGGAGYLVLNNIVQYASPDLRTVLMAKVDDTRMDYLQQAEELAHFAQAWELEPAKHKNLGREMVGAVGERRDKDTRSCYECGKPEQLRAACPKRTRGGTRKPDLTLAVSEGTGKQEEAWILDSGSSRHLIKNASWLDDVEDCEDECVQPDGNALSVTKRGTLTLRVTAGGEPRTVKLTNVYYAENVVHNLISFGQLDQKGYSLMRKDGQRIVATHDATERQSRAHASDHNEYGPMHDFCLWIAPQVLGRRGTICGLYPESFTDELERWTRVAAQVFTKQTPPLGEIVVFGSPCTVYHDPRNKNFSQPSQPGMTVGIGEDTKGYRVYLPRDRVVVMTQHVKNIETLDKTQNEQVQRLYLGEEDEGVEEETTDSAAGAARTTDTERRHDWEPRQEEEQGAGQEEALAARATFYKTKRDAEGLLGRLKARLVACGNEQEFGVNYGITFAAVIDMTSVNLILVLARKWGVPAKHGDVPNAYVKAEKEAELDIYLRIPQGMILPDELLRGLGVTSADEVVLELRKALYGLKQAGRLWSKLLHKKLLEIGFMQSLVDMCLYFRLDGDVLLVVGVYVDDLLVTGTKQAVVDAFFGELTSLSVKDLGCAHKFLGMRIVYDDLDGYSLDQEVMIIDLLKEHGMEHEHGVHTPIGKDSNECAQKDAVLLSATRNDGGVTVSDFQSLVGSLLWLARCTRPDIALPFTRQHETGSNGPLEVVGYCDADFAADKQDRKSVTGGFITIDGMAVAWICCKQGGVSLSTMEAEYIRRSVVVRARITYIQAISTQIALRGDLHLSKTSPMRK
ncbi:unnamed protein product [Phytophthora fragariaefolia]|uniref:Unnamed protein product n=1 Tax=Phytophthora fragariaefolia TaxID=1490495 RepID=A0A9W6XWR7_9STRA|nr:unnamed protein product [Phytophthora fragariaefolia]